MAFGLLIWNAAARGLCGRINVVGRSAVGLKTEEIDAFLVVAEKQLCRSSVDRMVDAIVVDRQTQ